MKKQWQQKDAQQLLEEVHPHEDQQQKEDDNLRFNSIIFSFFFLLLDILEKCLLEQAPDELKNVHKPQV